MDHGDEDALGCVRLVHLEIQSVAAAEGRENGVELEFLFLG